MNAKIMAIITAIAMVRDVYGVDCEVRDEGGVPHVVLGSVMPVRTGI